MSETPPQPEYQEVESQTHHVSELQVEQLIDGGRVGEAQRPKFSELKHEDFEDLRK